MTSLLAIVSLLAAAPTSHISGDVRVQFLSRQLVRIEQKGPLGFEDRLTFHVVRRDLPDVAVEVVPTETGTRIGPGRYFVELPKDATSISQVRIVDAGGNLLYQPGEKLPEPSLLPAPSAFDKPWAMADSPRLIPPTWGALPAPETVDPLLAETSGWDTRNDAPDLYVFVPGDDGWRGLREDYLHLTGPTPLPAMHMLGLIDSRYFPYTEQSALETIDTYRKKSIPLDVFVVDTDWRKGGSHGYAVDEKYFPDMPRFLREAHERRVRLMFNDHPEPINDLALSPEELNYRFVGLTSLLQMGMDHWWFDRNWSTWLREPMPGLAKEVWGQRLYHDVQAAANPTLRPTIMTNVQGIDNGLARYAPSPASHRYPIWWTGDTQATWAFLRRGVQNAVTYGSLGMLPYLSEDLGGHAGTPSTELYVRFAQFGALSPIMRFHCTMGQSRYPWDFGPEAENIVREYARMRYRLMPTIYSAAHQAYLDGTPILRRLDIFYPGFPEAASDRQYLFGEDLLVAPVDSSVDEGVPIPAAYWPNGVRSQLFANKNLEGEAIEASHPSLSFDWQRGAPAPDAPADEFSMRFEGDLAVPAGKPQRLGVISDDGVRVWVNDELVIDQWKDQAGVAHFAPKPLAAGKSYKIRVEYYEAGGEASISLTMADAIQAPLTPRQVWIPPGEWVDAWSGRGVTGPKTVEVRVPISVTPMWVRRGGFQFLGPDMQTVYEKPWDPIVVDAYPGPRLSQQRTLYEDDGRTTGYLSGQSSTTKVRLSQTDGEIRLQIDPREGEFPGMLPWRGWVLRLHVPKNSLADAKEGARPLALRPVRIERQAMPFGAMGSATPASAGEVVDIVLPPADASRPRDVVVRLRKA